MKKTILISILAIFSCAIFGQQIVKKVDLTTTYTYNGAVAKGDTVIKSQVKYYTYYTGTLINQFQAQVTVANVSGTTTGKLYVYESFDNANYYFIDSATTFAAAGTVRTAKLTVSAPYIRLTVKGLTNTQKTSITKVITAIKTEK